VARCSPAGGSGPEGTGIGEEQRGVEAEDHQAGQLLGVWVLQAVVLAAHPGNEAQRGLIGPPCPPEDVEDRERYGDGDALENTEQGDAEKRGDGQ